MIKKNPLIPDRVRKISGSFAFIEHRFLRDGFWSSLCAQELALYMFLVLAADRQGLSYYSFDKICTLLSISPEEYILARNCLISKDLIAFDGLLFQVLQLPAKPVFQPSRALETSEDMLSEDPATIRGIIAKSLASAGCEERP